jgi:hypothetical protein
MKRRVLFLVTLEILCLVDLDSGKHHALHAQGPPEKILLTRALGELTNAIAQFRQELVNPEPAIAATRALVWLQNQTKAWTPRSPDDGRPLRESIERMTRAMGDVSDKAARETLLQLISADLEDKVAFCRTEGLTARREVKVTTKRDGVVEVRGFEVLYLEKFLENDPKAKPQQFRGFSSPAVDVLVPGRYVFWSREPGAADRNGARKDGRVAESPQDPIEVLTP